MDRLAELIQQRDQELAMLKGLTFQGPSASSSNSPGGSPLSLTGRASVTSAASPGEAAGAGAGAEGGGGRGDSAAAAAGAKVLFSLPGQR